VKIWDPRGALVANIDGSYLADGKVVPIGSPIDRNGNYMPLDGTDTLGRQNLVDTVVPPTGTDPVTTEYLDVPLAQGQTGRYTITYETIPVSTNFNWPASTSFSIPDEEYTGTLTVIKSLQLPDGTSYKFGYEPTYGELNSITLPHGGMETLSYTNSPGTATDSPIRWVQSHNGADGLTTFAWAQTPNPLPTGFQRALGPAACSTITNSTNSASGETAYTFGLCGGSVFPVQVKHGTANLTKIDAIELYSNDTTNPCPVFGQFHVCEGFQWRNITGKTTIIPTTGDQALITDIQYAYQVPGAGIPTTVKQWDYYTGAVSTTLPDSPPGLPAQEVDQVLGYSVNNAIFTTSVTTKDSTGVARATVTYAYDEPGYISPSPSTVPNHDNHLVTGNRGNITTVQACCGFDSNGNSVPSKIHMYYDDAGAITKVVDALGYATTLAYDPTDTFPQTITAPQTTTSTSQVVSHVVSKTYDPATGQLASFTDENGQTISYTYDQYGREFTISYSNGGTPVTLKTTTYPSANEVDIASLQSDNKTINSSISLDSYGRTRQVKQGGVSVDTTYDSSGRVYRVSNPHRATAAATDGETVYSYDELGRMQSVQMPSGGGSINYSYVSNTVKVTDPLQHYKIYSMDSFGNITSVQEMNPLDPNTPLITAYQYLGPSGELTEIDQKGGSASAASWRTRQFNYDGFGQLVSQTTPESGTTHYVYDLNGNLIRSLNANPTNNSTLFGYDADNRLVAETIQGGPSYSYVYDGADASGDRFGMGQLTSMSNGSTVQARYTHDAFGRVVSAKYCLPSDCSFGYTVQAAYDFQDNLTSLTYPDGRQLALSYDQLNRPISETLVRLGSTSMNTPYISNISYTPTGLLQQATYGNGVQVGATYDPNQNITSLVYFANDIAVSAKTYTWDVNGANLRSVVDSSSGRTQTFSYDQLDRIASVGDSGSTSRACVVGLPVIPAASETYSIDGWGNTQQTGTWNFNQLTGADNRVQGIGYNYDSAGDMTQDALGKSYNFQADGLLSSSNGTTYAYDGFGQRVRKEGSSTGSNEYIYFGDQPLAMRDPSTGIWTDRIYGPTGALAHATNDQTTYRISDHLGSLANLMDGSASVLSVTATLPYGQLVADTSGDSFVFTDHERDGENQTDHTEFRQFSVAQGRWLSPDPSLDSYDLTDPQSLNRYTYLSNRPVASTDPLGLDDDFGGDDLYGGGFDLTFGWDGSAGIGVNSGWGADGSLNWSGDQYYWPSGPSAFSAVDAGLSNGLDSLQVGLHLPGVTAQQNSFSAGPQTVSPQGQHFIKMHETIGGKPNLTVYTDTSGIKTIGYGHMVLKGEDFSKGIDATQAEAIFQADLAKHTKIVKRALMFMHVPQNQFDALVDVAFNSPRAVRSLIVSMQLGVTPNELMFRSTLPRPNKGLLNRRYDEAIYFMYGVPKEWDLYKWMR